MALATMLAAVLAGCGNKGPLYLPEEPPPPAGGTAEAGEGDNSDAESDTGDGT